MSVDIHIPSKKSIYTSCEKKPTSWRLPVKLVERFQEEAEEMGYTTTELAVAVLNAWLLHKDKEKENLNRDNLS